MLPPACIVFYFTKILRGRDSEQMDLIHLKDLSFKGYHGVFPEEAGKGQCFIVNLTLEADLSAAIISDDVDQTVNYAEVFSMVRDIVEKQRCHLLEALSGKIIAALFSHFPAIMGIRIRIDKPEAPIDGDFDSVGIEIHRTR